jgi:predicted acylesterase/phospholipase RssA
MKRFGLALGSGAARGFAHIGVLLALEKHGLRPDYVAGTSIGAAIGAIYCSGTSASELRELAVRTDWQDLIDFTVPKTGMIAGNRFEKYLQKLTGNKRFSELLIPLRVVATDIRNSHKVVFSQGNVAKAVRASISIPGVFMPVHIDRHELVDGGLVDPVPFDVVREMGSDVVAAVDLSVDFDSFHIHGSRVRERTTFFEVMEKRFIRSQVDFFKEFLLETKRFRLPQFTKKYAVRLYDSILNPNRMYNYVRGRHMPKIIKISVHSTLIMISMIAQEQLKNAKVEIIIKPMIKGDQQMGFDCALEFIKAGERATELVIPDLKELLGKDA